MTVVVVVGMTVVVVMGMGMTVVVVMGMTVVVGMTMAVCFMVAAMAVRFMGMAMVVSIMGALAALRLAGPGDLCRGGSLATSAGFTHNYSFCSTSNDLICNSVPRISRMPGRWHSGH